MTSKKEVKLCKARTEMGKSCPEIAEWEGYCIRHYEIHLKLKNERNKRTRPN